MDSIAEVFGSVIGGACLAIPSVNIVENPIGFIESCQRLKATRISVVPTVLEVILLLVVLNIRNTYFIYIYTCQ